MADLNFMHQIALRMPLVWVTTNEPARVANSISEGTDRDVFRFDAMKGLLRYNRDRSEWRRVTITNAEGQVVPLEDKQDGFAYILQESEDAILLFQADKEILKGMGELIHSLLFQYRSAFSNDDFGTLPLQIVMTSHEDEVHPEFSRVANHVMHELPSEEELQELVEHMTTKIEIDGTPEGIASAGLGLSENEFISASLCSVRENGTVETEFINRKKKELLKQSNVLDVRTPDLTLEDLGGLDLAKKLVKQIATMWENPEEYEKFDVTPLRRVMLVGVPGVGKSLICEAIASALGVDLAKGGVSSSLSKWVGESEANMRRTFSTLKRMAPIVFWIDEFGRDMSGSGTSNDGGTTDRVHGEFLTGVQELPDNIFLAAAANRIEDLPPEMLRADRFDRIMFAGFPTEGERKDIFKIHLGKNWEQYDLDRLATASDFFTGAEIKALIKEVKFEIVTAYRRLPTTEEIIAAIPNVKNRVWVNKRRDIVAMYQRAKVEWYWASSAQKAEADMVLARANDPIVSTTSYRPTTAPKKAMSFGNVKEQ